jgi:hypothetical protein
LELRPILVQPRSISTLRTSPASSRRIRKRPGPGSASRASRSQLGGAPGGWGRVSSLVAAAVSRWSWRAEKIESRRKREPPQSGQRGSRSVVRVESWAPQSTQKKVPAPGTAPAPWAPSSGSVLTLSKIGNSFLPCASRRSYY